jgi:hypothetical protein
VSVRIPKGDGTKVTGVSVGATPTESFLVPGEILGNSQDRIGKSFVQSGFIAVDHIVGSFPIEPFVVIDSIARVERNDGCKKNAEITLVYNNVQ